MAKHAHISRYYADDKDIADLVSQSGIKPQHLVTFLRERGIIVSTRMTKEELIHYFRFLSLAWPDFDNLLVRLDRPDREEDFTGCRIKARGLEITALLEQLEIIKLERTQRLAEIHKAELVLPSIIELRVQYTEIDPSKTRALQRRDRWLTIRIEKSGYLFKIRHHDNARAKAIVDQLEKDIIDVSDLSSAKRDDFFIQMARGIKGYELDGVNDLKVERPASPNSPDQNEEVSVKPTRAETKFRGIVRKAVLSGTDLLLSEDYQRYSSKGYTMSKMVWMIRETANISDIVELMAEFRGKGGTEFRYDVVGTYHRQQDDSISDTRTSVRSVDKQRFLDLLEASAYATLETIRPRSQDLTPLVPVQQVPASTAKQTSQAVSTSRIRDGAQNGFDD